MEQAVSEENFESALKSVMDNKGGPGIDRMTTAELKSHVQRNGWILRDKLLKGPIFQAR